jgi:hypothetical protein
MLSYQSVEPHTLELLKAIMGESIFQDMRLVGGTALALQYGHRKSVDLDFFGSCSADNDQYRETLSKIGKVVVLKESARIRIYQIDGIKVDFVEYAYPWLDSTVEENHIRLASPVDIAAMKIYAAEGRGTRKDFVDLYFLLKHYTLSDLLKFYRDKYPEHSEFAAIRSLTYFEDAEKSPMPFMFAKDKWEHMKARISREVANYISKGITD